MKFRCSVFLLFLLISVAALPAQEPEPGILKCGVMVGAVVDPFAFGIEQAHAAAAAVLSYQKRIAVSLRPTILFNSRRVFFRVPLLLEIPLFESRWQVLQKERSLTVCAVGGAGAGTWDGGTQPALRLLLSGGVELCLSSITFSGFITGVVRENGLDLLTDLFLGYLWELQVLGNRRNRNYSFSQREPACLYPRLPASRL